jgi:hypothetical protein
MDAVPVDQILDTSFDPSTPTAAKCKIAMLFLAGWISINLLLHLKTIKVAA